MTISCSHERAGALAGTVSISARTLCAVVTGVAASLEQCGIRKLVVVSGHGGNYVFSNIFQEANLRERRMLLYPRREAWTQARLDAGCETDSQDDMHGGELETSILLHAAPELVRPGWTDADRHAPHPPDLLTIGLAGYTTTGVIGYRHELRRTREQHCWTACRSPSPTDWCSLARDVTRDAHDAASLTCLQMLRPKCRCLRAR